MKIRQFDKDDWSSILDIYNKSKLDELKFENKKFKPLPLEKDKKRLTGLEESDIFVAEDKIVIGYGALFGSEIRALFVHPDRRGEGVGITLLQFLLSKAEGPVSLHVAKSNAPAKNLYKKFGFAVTKEYETKYNGIPVIANQMDRIRHCG